MLDAAEKFMSQLARPARDQSRRAATVVEMLMRRHRRDADHIAGFPRIFGLLVDVVALALLHVDHFFEDMAVFAGVAVGLDLHRH